MKLNKLIEIKDELEFIKNNLYDSKLDFIFNCLINLIEIIDKEIEEQKIKELQSKRVKEYEICFGEDESFRIEKRLGCEVQLPFELTGIIYVDGSRYGKSYHVAEKRSGAKISSGKSKKEAIKIAIEKLTDYANRNSIEKLKSVIEDWINEKLGGKALNEEKE